MKPIHIFPPIMIVDPQTGFWSYVDRITSPPPPSMFQGVIQHLPPDLGPLKKIRMLCTAKGSPDGLQVNEYLEGQIYEVPGGLSENFIGSGRAEEVIEHEQK